MREFEYADETREILYLCLKSCDGSVVSLFLRHTSFVKQVRQDLFLLAIFNRVILLTSRELQCGNRINIVWCGCVCINANMCSFFINSVFMVVLKDLIILVNFISLLFSVL